MTDEPTLTPQEQEWETFRLQQHAIYEQLALKPEHISLPTHAFIDHGLVTIYTINWHRAGCLKVICLNGDQIDLVVLGYDTNIIPPEYVFADDQTAAIQWIIDTHRGLKTRDIRLACENGKTLVSTPTGMITAKAADWYIKQVTQ